jgi:hypothetical protein
MKKFFISVGLVAAGTANLQAAYAPGLNSMETTKFWSVSGTLRGFYDDNYNTAPNGQKQGSAGYEVSPSVSINVPMQQTEFDLKYTYGLYYYQERRNQGNDPYDQTHQVDLWLDHAFSERWQSTVHDTFVVGNEPGLLNPNGGPTAQPLRVNGDNYVNEANVALTTDWTRLFSTVLTYNNGYYDYTQSGGTATNPSQNGLLTRLTQSVSLDLQWAVAPETTALVGFSYQWVDYLGGEPISQYTSPIPALSKTYYSEDLNNHSYIPYIGLQHSFLANLSASAKIGAQITEYGNNSASPNNITPWVQSSASYTYAEGSYVQLGVQHVQNPSSVSSAATSRGNITQGQQSTVVTASVNQEITAKLMGSIIGAAQFSQFNQGAYNNDTEQYYSLGANLTYNFNQHLSAELGYNLDVLQSSVAATGPYSRNRVYLGVTAEY